MDTQEQDLVQGLAATAVQEVAPEEMLMFQRTADTFFDDPDRLQATQSTNDEPLGFGVDLAVTLIAPVALAVATDVVKYLFEELKKRFADETTDGIVSLLKRMFRNNEAGDSTTEQSAPTVTFDKDEIARVRALAVEKAMTLGLPADEAQLLGDSMAGSMLGDVI